MKQFIVGIIFMCSLMEVGFSQSSESAGDKAFKAENFSEAVELYISAISEKRKASTFDKVANTYEKLEDYTMAQFWYMEGFNQFKNPQNLLFAGKSAQKSYDFEFAKEVFAKYLQLTGEDDVAMPLIENCNLAMNSIGDSSSFKIWPSKYNSLKSEMAWTKDENSGSYLFCSENGKGGMDVFKAEGGKNGSFGLSVVQGGINTFFDETAVVSRPGTNELYFTRRGTGEFGEFDFAGYRIFVCTFSGGKTSRPKEAKIPNQGYSEGFPTFSADGNRMIFSAQKKEGKGGMDLYESSFGGGKWSEPTPLGENFNTAGEEVYPFINENGDLYFSSTGLPGYGELDIYVAKQESDGFGFPVNLSFPINSPFNDFAYFSEKEDKIGHFSSDRASGIGQIDMYTYSFQSNLKIVLREGSSNKTLPYVQAILVDDIGNEFVYFSDKNGVINHFSGKGRKIMVQTQPQGYSMQKEVFNIGDDSGTDEFQLLIQRVNPFNEGDYQKDTAFLKRKMEIYLSSIEKEKSQTPKETVSYEMGEKVTFIEKTGSIREELEERTELIENKKSETDPDFYNEKPTGYNSMEIDADYEGKREFESANPISNKKVESNKEEIVETIVQEVDGTIEKTEKDLLADESASETSSSVSTEQVSWVETEGGTWIQVPMATEIVAENENPIIEETASINEASTIEESSPVEEAVENVEEVILEEDVISFEGSFPKGNDSDLVGGIELVADDSKGVVEFVSEKLEEINTDPTKGIEEENTVTESPDLSSIAIEKRSDRGTRVDFDNSMTETEESYSSQEETSSKTTNISKLEGIVEKGTIEEGLIPVPTKSKVTETLVIGGFEDYSSTGNSTRENETTSGNNNYSSELVSERHIEELENNSTTSSSFEGESNSPTSSAFEGESEEVNTNSGWPDESTSPAYSAPIESRPAPSTGSVSKGTIEYRVQLGMFKNPASAPWFLKLDNYLDRLVHDKAAGLHRYFVGGFSSVSEAEVAKKSLRTKGFSDCIVRQVLNGTVGPVE